MLNLIFKGLFRRKTRTLLTVAGIAVGVSMIVALGAMGEGIRTGYQSMFGGSGADLVMMQKGAYDITLSGVDEEVVDQVAAIPGVQAAGGLIVGNVTTPDSPYFFVFGYEPGGFGVKRFKIVDGVPLKATAQATRGERELILGKQASEALKLNVGDTLRLTGGTFRIVGVYTTGSGFEDAAAVMSLQDAQQLLQKHRQVGAVQIQLRDPRQIDRIRARLERAYAGLTISGSSQAANDQQTVGAMQAMAGGIGLLAVVIGGVGMTNTVMMSVFERTREIGTLRALGWGRRRVLLMVMGESVVLGALGGLVGCAFGAAMIEPMSRSAATSFLQGQLTPGLLAQGMLAAIVLGGIGGIYPARWASRLLPVEAMRYQGGSDAASNHMSRVRSETLRSLWRRRGRTALTVVGISIGLAAVILLGGIADSFIDEFSKIMSAGGVDLVARQADASDMSYSAISERAGKQIAALPGVKSVSGIVLGAVTMKEIPFLFVMGYHPQEPAISRFTIVEGRGLSGNREIILGQVVADALKVGVGDVVRLGDAGFRVVGLFETSISWEQAAGVVSLRDGQALLGKPRQVSLYGIEVTDPQQAEAIQAQIESVVPEVAVAPSSEFTDSLPDLQNMNVMMVAISALAIIVGGIGMMNTVFMSVFERTRDIGTLRALGWKRRRVLGMVLRESIALGLLGIVVGTLLSIVFGALMRQIPLWGEWLIVAFSPGLMARALIVALVLGTLGGLYPAWRATKLSPVEALRYE